MEFLKVSENKLKIMLDKAEIKKYKLEDAEPDLTDAELKARFWQILDKAKESCGFSSRGEKLLMQFYPSKSGGEIFVTKLGAITKSAERSISSSARVAMLDTETKLFKFDSLIHLAGAVYQSRDSLPRTSRAYSGEGGEFFLAFEDRCEISAVIAEFGKAVPPMLEAYISEHSIPIDRPTETLSAIYRSKR